MKKLVLTAFLCVLGGAISALAQTRQVDGTVRDAGGNTLPGVSVIEVGTSNGALTDENGKFSIDVPAGSILKFASLGYKDEEVTVTSSTTSVSVVMNEDMELLDEVVVVGFATQKKINVTGAVGTVDSDALAAVPVQNALQALQGHIPGLTITQSDGQLNTKSSINVRGIGTIGQGSNGDVLVLIDGVEGDLSLINPQDIENISVLKDAAASSIYGSRAPFGVILVTTKKGTKGKAKINYNNSFRFNTPLNMPEQMDSYTWALFFNDASNNAGWGDRVGVDQMQRIIDFMEGRISYNTIPEGDYWSNGYNLANDNVDYYDVFYKDVTFSQEHNLSVSGGTDVVNYYISANYLSDGGKMKWGGDGLARYNVFGKIDAQLRPWVKVGYSSRYIRSDYHKPSHMDDNFFQEIGRQSWPVSPLYDPNGILFNDHVLNMRDGGQTTNNQTVTQQQINITLEPLKGLRIVADGTYKNTIDYDHVVWQPYAQTAVDGISKGTEWYQNDVSESSVKNDYYNFNVYADYEHLFKDAHYLKVMAGFQGEGLNYRNVWARKYGVMVSEVPTIDAANGLDRNGEEIPSQVSGGYASWATAGFFGRVNYNYKERYLLEANLRCDGSSRFRQDTRWGLFPSVSVGWNIANEPFFKPAKKVVDMLKVRASWGSLGNQNTTSYYPTYTTMPYAASGGSWIINGVKPNTSWAPGLISTSLTWETVESVNVGLDFALFNSRLSGSFDWFQRDTRNMVGPADELPAILGTSVPVTNNTDLRTRGWEAELMWKDNVGAFNYSARVVVSDSKAVVMKYSNPSGTIDKYYAGMEWGEFWGYETIGIAKTDEEMNEHLATLPNGGQSNLGSDWQAGDVMYKDLNGDGKIDSGSYTLKDHGDMKVIGNTTPRYNFGIDLSVAWKGVDLRVFIQGVGMRQYMQSSRYFFGATSDVWQSMGLVQHADYFRDDEKHPLGLNLDSYYPRPVWGTDKNRKMQTRWVQDASYARLKNLQLGYTFPVKWTEKIGVSNLRVFFSGENLFTVTKMSDIFDPETISGTSLGNVYPLSRTYSFGVNVTF